MWPFKSKYDKLTREEVVSAICELEQQSREIEDGLLAKQKQIDDLMTKGKNEKSKDVKLFYAKKINALKSEREQSVRRAIYLMYNVQLLQKLKAAIDDNKFFKNSTKASLGNLLADQKGLAKFLNSALGTRVAAEEVLTSADETFRDIEAAYEKNESIYGESDADNSLLAMFEDAEQIEAETGAAEETSETAEKSE